MEEIMFQNVAYRATVYRTGHAIKLSLRIQEDFDPIVYCTSAKNAQISKYVLASYVRSFAFVTQSFKLVL